jgi:hypothetical protein
MRRFIYENGLALGFLALFLLSLIGQSIAGLYEFNDHQTAHEEPTVSYLRYVASSDFGADVLENWQSEWLQFWVFAVATVWLVQKGSNESKRLGEEGLEDDKKQRVGPNDGRLHDLPAPARLAGIQARRRAARETGTSD